MAVYKGDQEGDVWKGGRVGGRWKRNGLVRRFSGTVRGMPWAENGRRLGGTVPIVWEGRDEGGRRVLR